MTESGHRFGKKPDILQITFTGKKGKYLDTMEKFYIYAETKKNNQINDKNTVTYNKIYEAILENQQT
jgi:endo-alpha-1,4-polygalactosaminidase (GH114 family)